MPKKKSSQPEPSTQGVPRMYNKFDELAKQLSDDDEPRHNCPPGFPPGFDFGEYCNSILLIALLEYKLLIPPRNPMDKGVRVDARICSLWRHGQRFLHNDNAPVANVLSSLGCCADNLPFPCPRAEVVSEMMSRMMNGCFCPQCIECSVQVLLSGAREGDLDKVRGAMSNNLPLPDQQVRFSKPHKTRPGVL
eukprot:6705337-Pyramimonas_sp.AAC.1